MDRAAWKQTWGVSRLVCGPETWSEQCRGPVFEGGNLENAVHGALQRYDLPDLRRVLRELAETGDR